MSIDKPPTPAEFKLGWQEDHEDLEPYEDKTNGTWRHGHTGYVILFRKSDATFWKARYRAQSNGDWHSIRDEDLEPSDISRVIKVQRMVSSWEVAK